jgi:hypothetical protein
VEKLRSDERLDLVFFYLGEVDETGHATGFHRDSAAYRAAVARDARVGEVLEAMRARRPGIDARGLASSRRSTPTTGGTIDLNHGRDIAEHRDDPVRRRPAPSAARGAVRAAR